MHVVSRCRIGTSACRTERGSSEGALLLCAPLRRFQLPFFRAHTAGLGVNGFFFTPIGGNRRKRRQRKQPGLPSCLICLRVVGLSLATACTNKLGLFCFIFFVFAFGLYGVREHETLRAISEWVRLLIYFVHFLVLVVLEMVFALVGV